MSSEVKGNPYESSSNEVMYDVEARNDPEPQAIRVETPKTPEPEDGSDSDAFDPIVNARKKLGFLPDWAFLILECIIVSALFLLPSLLILTTVKFRRYDLMAVVHGRVGVNLPMEFIRFSIILTAGYCLFVITQFLASQLPKIATGMMNFLDVKMTKHMYKRIGYLHGVRHFTALFLFSILMFYILDGVLMNYSPLYVNGKQVDTYQFYIIRTFIALGFIGLFFAFERLFIQVIGSDFREIAFGDRIRDINFRYAVLSTLDKAASYNKLGKTKLFSMMGDRQLGESDTEIYGLNLAEDRMGLTNTESATALANRIFNFLCKSTSDFITPEDFRDYFKPEVFEKAFHLFTPAMDEDDNAEDEIYNRLNREQFVEAVVSCYRTRCDMVKALKDHEKILRKLDYIAISLTALATCMVVFPVYKVNFAVWIGTFVTFIWTFNWLFGGSIGDIFKSCVFLFIVHPFDVADKIQIGGDVLVVDKIDLMSTRFIKGDGSYFYVTNAGLAGKEIINIRRSPRNSETVEMLIRPQTTSAQIEAVRAGLEDFLKRNARDFVGSLGVAGYEVLDANRMKINLTVFHKSNFQDGTLRFSRRNAFMQELKALVEQNRIEWAAPPTVA